MKKDLFTKGKNANWDKLEKFMDENYFERGDFLACVCASLLREPFKNYETSLMVGGAEFEIKIERK